MRKKIVCGTIALVLLCIAGFAMFDCALWRPFGFQYCQPPEALHVSDLAVNENTCRIRIADMTVGSFSATKYNGLVFSFDDGVLSIGIHKGVLGAKDEIVKEIAVDAPITEVRLCGNGNEQVIYTK